MSKTSLMTQTERYAAGALFALALHQAQIHQTRPLGFSAGDDLSDEQTSCSSSSSDLVLGDPELWVNGSSGLLRPVFRFFEISPGAWSGLEETAGSPSAEHHVGAMVAGRFVNAYSTNDWMVGVTFRASLLTQGLAGIQPIDDVYGIENIDVTDLIEGHSSYLWATQEILDRLELYTYYPVFRTFPGVVVD